MMGFMKTYNIIQDFNIKGAGAFLWRGSALGRKPLHWCICVKWRMCQICRCVGTGVDHYIYLFVGTVVMRVNTTHRGSPRYDDNTEY